MRQGYELIHSFLALRKAVGFIAMALPFVLLWVHGGGLISVSEGYDTAGGALFVAGVCTIGVLALFCLWLFSLSDAPRHANRKKDQRNLSYDVCGAVIVVCLLALLMHFAVGRWLGPHGVFWLETAMLLAFGFSWAVKGEAIAFLNDSGALVSTPEAGHHPT